MTLDQHQIDLFIENGYLVVEDIISQEELEVYQRIYYDFLNGKIKSGKNRSDLGDSLGNRKTTENITQIMWPSDFVEGLTKMNYHQNSLMIVQNLLGEDIEMDFDMLINKAPNTNTSTPWHQDAAYWEDLPDKRAVSCWLAIDKSTIDNGCMWYVPKSHLNGLREHRFAGKVGGALVCEGAEKEGVAIELSPGSCVLHDGCTLHYSRGNSTNDHRRAFIINFRPKKMITLERSKGVDHGRNGNSSNRKLQKT